MYIKIYASACPICKRDVKGNRTDKYFCRNCNLLFDYRDLLNPGVPKIMTDNPSILARQKKKKGK